MPLRVRLLFSMMSLSLFLVAAVPLYTELTQRSDIWWTPRSMLIPLPESTDRVEVYVRGKSLATLIQSGDLRVTEGSGSSAVTASDLGFRFNNRNRVRAGRLPLLLVRASACGALACLFLLTLTGRLAYRGERER